MTEFLLELYSEEIPAGLQRPAAEHFAAEVGAKMFFHTPQRIALVCDLPDVQPDENIERKGPKVGAPEQAVSGILRSCGVASVDERWSAGVDDSCASSQLPVWCTQLVIGG